METIIRLNKQLHDSIDEAASMNRYLVKVLNQVNDGIIAFSDYGMVTVFNEKSEALLGIKSAAAIGQNISQVIRDKSICDFLLVSADISNQLFKLHDTDVIINKFRIEKMHCTVCTLKNARDTIDMENKLRQSLIKKGYIGKYKFEDIVGSSPLMRHTVETAKKLAAADLSILISGESGVGKELFASAIHNSSPRKKGPFLAVNFSALPEELVESELFGYDEGAFTGASKGGRIGLFEQASGGTIFLDEIGDISFRLQARLLRVLQEKEIRRVGGTEIIPVDVRIISATNKDLAQMCRTGLFREDLYHRLRKLYLKLPPLRDHIEDLTELIDFIKRMNGRSDLILSDEVMEILRRCLWSGNIRELTNVIEYFIVVADNGKIEADDIPPDFFEIKMPGTDFCDPYTDDLYKKGIYQESISVMKAISECMEAGCAASRKAVAVMTTKEFPYLTENKIRRLTDFLLEIGLINKQPGPGGMHLTKEGHEFMQKSSK
jgi:sigma-54 dependent transcriptional regulator, acetoin dehydrogenase operon transcriptional activator AcoR